MLEKLLQSKWLVPALTILIVAGAIWGLLKLTQKVGENLAPIKPRVLVFGAKWCQYCPTDQQLADLQHDYPDVEIIHVDVDRRPELAKQYHVKRLPTIIVCEDDGKTGCFLFRSLRELRDWLDHESR